MKQFLIVLCAVVITSTLGGCATLDKWMGKSSDRPAVSAKTPAEKKAFNSQFSGYLVDYSDMHEMHTPSGGTSLRWVSPDLKKGQYTAIIIDPIGLYPRPPLLAKVSKGRMLEALKYITEHAKKEIGNDLKIVDKPGPGVLRVDAAITGVRGNIKFSENSTKENTSVAMMFTDLSPLAVPQEHGFVVHLETRLRDSQTNKLMAKSVRAGVGSPVGNSNARIVFEDMKPVLDNWVHDADAFVREYIK